MLPRRLSLGRQSLRIGRAPPMAARAGARQIARSSVRFWAKMQQCPPYTSKPPSEARKLIEASLPEPCRAYQLKRRIAGLGSLGHPRILALSSWEGAFIAREAKGIRTSAWAWCRGMSSQEVYGARWVERSIRVKDTCARFQGQWLVRGLRPDCWRSP